MYRPRPFMGGARAIGSTSGSTVVGRTRLLISISPPAVLAVALAAADDGDADDDDWRDDVTVTSSRRVLVAAFDDVVDFRAWP